MAVHEVASGKRAMTWSIFTMSNPGLSNDLSLDENLLVMRHTKSALESDLRPGYHQRKEKDEIAQQQLDLVLGNQHMLATKAALKILVLNIELAKEIANSISNTSL